MAKRKTHTTKRRTTKRRTTKRHVTHTTVKAKLGHVIKTLQAIKKSA